MRRIAFVATLIATGLVASSAFGLHNQPFKGKSFKINVVTAYEPCTAPDTLTNDGQPACSVPVRSDPGCGFGGGQGKIQLKSLTVGNTGFRVKLNGLDPPCENQVINFVISFRKTGHHCNGASCTMVDVIDHPFSACSVINGVCKDNGALFLPGGADIGQIEIIEVRGERLGNRTFATGVITRKP
jgi:hypothetical protein